MYFTPEARARAVRMLRRSLAPGGWLAVSPAEASAEVFAPLEVRRVQGAIFFHRRTAANANTTIGQALTGPETVNLRDLLTPLSTPAAPVALAPVVCDAEPLSGLPSNSAPSPVSTAAGALVEDAPAALPVKDDLARARALADAGALEEARDVCLAARERDLLNPDSHLLLALICQEQHDLVAAVEALQRVIYLKPNSASAHFRLGGLLLQIGDRRRGRREMKTVLELSEAATAGGAQVEDDVLPEELIAAARACVESLE
jgi:chemotaxis protein methyltransferase CheR